MTSQRKKCLDALTDASHLMSIAQTHAIRKHTGGAQVERRIVHIREKLSELRALLTVDEDKQCLKRKI